MFINNLNPIAFEIFSIKIYWYSLSYIFGITFGWIYCKKKLIKDQRLLNIFDNLINYLIFGIIIGGRLGYVIIYNLEYFLKNFIEIFMIWEGGMSFHGGLIGIIVSTYFFSKKNNVNTYVFLDLIALVAPIGIFLGRISNFINSELYGRETDVLWAVKFSKIDNIYRHPSQIYEAILEGIVLFVILNYLNNKDSFKKPGIISSIFLILYSFFRILIEFFREPDSQIGYLILNVTMGQFISIIFLFFGIFLYLSKKNENYNKRYNISG
jgi:phosphatidylglycerol:prolipoprotein diacylglycerol transferase